MVRVFGLLSGLWACLATTAMANNESRAADIMKDWYKGLKSSKVIHAINCGGDNDYTDEAGITYEADKFYEGGVTTSGCGMHRWLMPNSEIYHAERWGE